MTRALLTAALIAQLTSTAALADDTLSDLFAAAAARDTALVRQLLVAGAAVDSIDAVGNTALMLAAACDYTDIAAILVGAGADVNVRGRIGNTALIHAAQGGAVAVGRLLLEAGARTNLANDYGNDARGLATGYGQVDLVAAIDSAAATRAASSASVALAF